MLVTVQTGVRSSQNSVRLAWCYAMPEMRAAGSTLIGVCTGRPHVLTREFQGNANTVTETYNTNPQAPITAHFLHLLITCV